MPLRLHCDTFAPERSVSSGPTDAESKVRVALVALDQAAQGAANRSVGMDAKASILLVVAGIIVTNTFSGDGLIYRSAVAVALLSSGLALASLWPAQSKGVHPATITDHLTAGPESLADFEYWLLAIQKAAAIAREKRLKMRGLLLNLGFTFAVIAMTLTGASILGNTTWFASWLGAYLSAFIANIAPTMTPIG